jgi:ATP-binding cassette, subfamily B, bacterial PglK
VRAKLLALLSPRERWQALGLLLLMAGGAALEVLGIGLVVPIVAALASPDTLLLHAPLRRLYEWSGAQSLRGFVLILLGVFLVLIVVKNAYLGLVAYLQSRFVYGKQARVSSRLFDSYVTGPYALHLERHSADVTRNLGTEVNNLFTGVIAPLLVAGAETMVLTLLVAVLLFTMPQPTVIVLLLGTVVVAGVYAALRTILGRYGSERATRSAERIRAIGDALGGLKEIKVLGREAFFMRWFAESNHKYIEASRIFATLNALPRLLIETLAILILVGAIFAVALSTGTELGAVAPAVVLLCLIVLRLMPAATRILTAVASIRFYRPSLDLICEELDTVQAACFATRPAVRGAASVMRLTRTLKVDDASFSYSGAKVAALDNISLTIQAGEVTALVGPSGAGKSTLADLILGVFDPQCGRILVDGIDIRGDLPGWRSCVGYVPQIVHLLDSPVRRNVAFGLADVDIDDQRVWEALKAAQIDSLVRALPGGLDERIGEHGTKLSGGQRQRLGIARALYADPQVLILDEATSALDAQTERAIADTLLDMRRARTVIVVAHRLDTIKRCDRLFFLAEGRLVASGSYEQLIAENFRFAQLVGAAQL